MARPIFVVGSMGSGTTLMRLMLDSHPNIMIAQETGFMRSVNAIRSIPFWNAKSNWIKRIGVSPTELDRSIEAFYDDVFGRAAAKRGAGRWGDKTPFHVEFIAEAARVFPEALFVGTVRHPGAVANSVGRFGWSWRKGVRHWCSANEWLLQGAPAVGERLRVWRYEDLVNDPEAVMREVLDFVGEPWDPRVLEHHRHHKGRAEGGTRAQDPVDTSRVARWAEQVSEADMELLASTAGPLAGFLGYDVEQSVPARPIAGAVPTELGASAAAWSDRADEVEALSGHARDHSFENSLYTQQDLAVELGAAYRAGARGSRIRRPYAAMLPEDQGGLVPVEPVEPVEPPPDPLGKRARRRLARMISPDS